VVRPALTGTHPPGAAASQPLGGGASVAEAVRLVRQSGLPNETNAMFTTLEGESDEVMSLIEACLMLVGRPRRG
jgi:uncharacterized protein YqgV (UPF0045/DUF77 family)